MDEQSHRRLAHMLRNTRVAALGTIRDNAPQVSMVAYSAADDFAEIYVLASRLAQHTQAMLANPRVSLMIAEPDATEDDPLTLARISIRGEARPIASSDGRYQSARAIHLRKFPAAAQYFVLGDFSLYFIHPLDARFVAGFGRIFNLSAVQLAEASGGD